MRYRSLTLVGSKSDPIIRHRAGFRTGSKRVYRLRSYLFCCSCGRRLFGNTKRQVSCYACAPKNAYRPGGHPVIFRVREDYLLDGLAGFLSERVFGPYRHQLLAAELKTATDAARQARASRISALRRSITETETRSKRLIRNLELAELRARRDELQRQLAAAEDEAHRTPNPALIDQLPVTPVDLASMPDEVSRRLFEALRLQIHYDFTTHIATCKITLTGDTIDAVARTSQETITAPPAGPAMGHHQASDGSEGILMTTEDQDQQSTEIPWLFKSWPLIIVAILVTVDLILLAVSIDSDVTRVAVPAIVTAVGTLALAVVTVRLSITERAHQEKLRHADELRRRLEADHQKAIKLAEERAASQRERELEFAAAVRQARRVATINGWEGPLTEPQLQKATVTLVNGSDYPIFDIGLIGARLEVLDGPTNHTEWPPEMRLEGESLHVAVLLPGERHIFRGNWKWRKSFAQEGNTVRERRATYTWTDDQGRAWQRDGNEPPKQLQCPWIWMEFWGDTEYVDQPDIKS